MIQIEGTVAIIGSGFAGLAAALAIKQSHYDVRIFDQKNVFEEQNTGVILWPNGYSALEKLGLGQEIQSIGNKITSIEVLNEHEEEISLVENLPVPIYSVNRKDLLKIFLSRFDRHNFHLSKNFSSFKNHYSGSVTLKLINEKDEDYSFIIGADGINSHVREKAFEDGKPQYSGFMTWRGISTFKSNKLRPGRLYEIIGLSKKATLCPLPDGEIYWVITGLTSIKYIHQNSSRKKRLINQFKDWPLDLANIIKETEEELVIKSVAYERPAISRWSERNVLLFGDAAHPINGYLQQGACIAFEDAATLKELLLEKQEKKVGEIFSAFESKRSKRLAEMTKLASQYFTVCNYDQLGFIKYRHRQLKRLFPKLVKDSFEY